MFSLKTSAVPGTSACIGIVVIALMALLLSFFSGTSFLDEAQEEFFVLAVFIPMSFIFYHQRKSKSSKLRTKKGSKGFDEKPKRSSKAGNASVSTSGSEENGPWEGNPPLTEKLEACAKSGDVTIAGKLMSEAIESGIESGRLAVCLGHLLQACVQAKDAKFAKASFESMKAAGVKVNVVHHGTLISVHAQTGDIAGAEKCLQDCIESGIEPNTVCYNTLLYACSRQANMGKIKEWLARMDEAKVKKDRITYSTITHGAIRAQDPACLEMWIKEADSEDFVLQPRTYEDGLGMCNQTSCYHVAETLFQSVLKHNVQVSSKMVQCVARARLYRGEAQACLKVLEQSLQDGPDLSAAAYVTAAEAANKLDDSCICTLWLSRAEEKLAHSIDNFALIASTALCTGKLDRAINWMEKLQESGSKEQINAGNVTLLKCCARLNDDASACNFADHVMKSSVPLTAEGYVAVIKACCRAVNLRAAESFLNKMLQADMMCDLSVFGNVIGLCARLEDVNRGEFWIDCYTRWGPLSDSSLRLFLDMCDKVASKSAKQCASRVIAKLNVDRIEFTSGENSLNLLKILLKLGELKKSESVLMTFSTKFGKIVACQGYQCIINAYAQAGNFKDAEHWLTTMTEAGFPADVIAYSTIIHACAKANDASRAEHVLVRMQEAGVEPNTICYNEVINAYAEIGDLQKAEQYFEAIKQRNLGLSTSTFNSMLKACVKSGDVGQAEVWYNKMISAGIEGVELDATTFGTLMNASKDSDPLKVEHWLQCARNHGVKLNVVHFSTAIHAHAKVGSYERAEALAEQALADGIDLNAMCFNNVIGACAEALQPGRAEEWLLKMRQSGIAPNSFTCFTIVNAWLKVNHFSRAKACIVEMEAEGLHLREEVFTAYAKTVARCGNWAQLEDCIHMAFTRGVQDNEFFLHAHLSALVRFRASSSVVVAAVRTAVARGVKLNIHLRAVLQKILPADRVASLIEECGGLTVSEGRSQTRKAINSRNRSPEVRCARAVVRTRN